MGWGARTASLLIYKPTPAAPPNAPHSTCRAASVRCKAFEPAGCHALTDGWGSCFSCRTCRAASARTPPWPSSWRSVSQCCLFCSPMLRASWHLSLCCSGAASTVLCCAPEAPAVSPQPVTTAPEAAVEGKKGATAAAAVACAQALQTLTPPQLGIPYQPPFHDAHCRPCGHQPALPRPR